ncbi:MAG: hypothetical protein ACE5EO_00385 [Candidatus Krumholzibacteriia bacterium]
MRRIVVIVVVVLSVCCHAPAFSQVFYTFANAPVVAPDNVVTGAYAAVGENDLFRLGGFGRLGLVKYFDVGVEVQLDLVDGDARGGAGVDVKLAAFPETAAIPFDLSLNAGVGFVGDGDFTLIRVPIGGIISSPFKLDSGKVLVPYVGAYLLVDNIDVEGGPLQPDISDTDVDAELRGGVRYELEGRLDLFGTLHIGRGALFAVGVTLKL